MSGFHLLGAISSALIIRKCAGFAKAASLIIVRPLDLSLEHDLSENRYPLFRIML
jgi:hypothetical protein